MRKLILLAAICAAGLFGSCDTSELHETSMRGVSPQFESCVVPINEALGDLQGVLAVMNGNTRSVSQNLQPVQILCKGDYSNTRVVTPNADVPMAYVVNFDEGGYAVLGADRRQSSVIVVAPCGEMSPAKLIEDKRAVDAGEKVDTRTYMNARVANYILSAPVDPQNQARIVGPPTPGDWQITEHQLPLMTTKWDQGVYYNMYCNTLDGINAPSGCVATAVAQMLVFNHWKYNKGIAKFGNYTPNWNLLDEAAAIPNIAETRNGRPVHIASAACEEETNQFIHEVGLAIGTIYTINASGASLQSIPSALSGNSYRYIKYIAPSPNPNPILKITRNMVWKEKHPVIMGGNSNLPPNKYAGHAWVVDGWMTKEKPSPIQGMPCTEYSLYCNYGSGDPDYLCAYGVFENNYNYGIEIIEYSFNFRLN